MAAVPKTDWRREFGISDEPSTRFFRCKADLDTADLPVPQAHVLRRAFDQLQLDGVLCQENVPVIYFRKMDRIDTGEAAELHRMFWNQGVAPLLVLLASDQVHIYSGLAKPSVAADASTASGFVQRLDWVAEELQKFIIAVESGEYFRTYQQCFDPRQRVDRNLLRNLQAARQELDKVQDARLDRRSMESEKQRYVLDALLCRLVFTCYLFDRKVIDGKYLEKIGIQNTEHLRDILNRKPRTEAKSDLYMLFTQLAQDFNGDLFSDDLEAEARQVRVHHLDILNAFFHGTDPSSGQQSFWPYDFGIIPIETVSAIYEHFLKAAGEDKKKESGAFYTPRFLAEIVLDRTLDGVSPLLGKRFLDPACGSGIFLVGLFNRLAEEWNRTNPNAAYDARLKGLTQILKTSLFGIDINRTACLITAFSLCLALLDQLSPPDIRRVLRKVKVLPRLVADETDNAAPIRCADFFTDKANLSHKVHFVVGNPPWAKVTNRSAAPSLWCASRKVSFPGRQIAIAFVWKAPDYLEPGGKVAFVLPHGTLFNHNPKAVEFQQRWFRQHAIELILNLADYQYFLFDNAKNPAVIVRYTKEEPTDSSNRIDYWAPKTDWSVIRAEIIGVLPQDRSRPTIREVFDDLKGNDAPLIWKERYWATSRDMRLLDRLRLYPRLRDVMGKRSRRNGKRWIIAEGFEPFGEKDSPATHRQLRLAQAARVEANTHELDLFLLRNECDIRRVLVIDVRRGISNTEIFEAPLVLVTEGFSKIAFTDFHVAYRHGIRGIHGEASDSRLLTFLTVYLRSVLARYFLFHTSASWGISRARIDVDDLMRLPFPFPEQTANPTRANSIVDEVSDIVTKAMKQVTHTDFGREERVRQAQERAEKLVDEYFDIDGIERMLIADTTNVIIPSVRPTRARIDRAKTILPASSTQRDQYISLLCGALNDWASEKYQVHGKAASDAGLGVGMVVLEKTCSGEAPARLESLTMDVLKTLHFLQRGAASRHGMLELIRGLKVFDKSLLYVTKPLGQRFWTRTAALNDADEIAGTILMRPDKGDP